MPPSSGKPVTLPHSRGNDVTTTAPISDVSAGTAQVRLVSGTRRVQALVAGAWYDLEGISSSDLLTNDRRYAARVTFAKIGTVSLEAVGAPPAGIDGTAIRRFGSQTMAPTRTSHSAEEAETRAAENAAASTAAAAAPTSAHDSTAAVMAIGAVVRVLKADQAANPAPAAS
jgi:hypothetical protein